jgi:hypothetical protein
MPTHKLGVLLVRIRENTGRDAAVVASGLQLLSGRIVLEWRVSKVLEIWESLETAEQAHKKEGRVIETIKF